MRTRFVSVALLAMLLAPTLLWAQVTTASNDQPFQRSQYVDGVLKTLTQSNSNFYDQRPLPPVAGATSPEVRAAQQALQSVADESGQLITALRYEARYSAHVRSLLGDALQVKSMADVLLARSSNMSSINQLANESQELDRQWRMLSHQLKQAPSISKTVLQRVARLDQANDGLVDLLKMTPQMDQSALGYFFAALGEDLGNLADDIQYDLYADPQRGTYQITLRQLQAKTQQLRLAVANQYPYADVKAYYQQLFTEWLGVKADLRAIDNRYIQRNLNRIDLVHDQIHELLWLPPVIDGRDILHQADQLIAQVDYTATNITMKDFIQQPNASDLFDASKSFYSHCQDFRGSVATSTQLESLRWDFRALEVSWTELKSRFNRLKNQETIQNVAGIETQLSELQHSLGLDSETDRGQSVELAQSLNNMSDLLYYNINRYIGQSNKYSPQFRTDSVRLSSEFHQSAEALQSGLMAATDEGEIRRIARKMSQQWTDLQRYLEKIPFSQRQELAMTSREIAPAMAKLQVMHSF